MIVHKQREAAPLALAAGSWRLLRWLERYPFQRARDLTVALAPWEKRTSVYTRLADLEARHLLEVVLPGVAGGQRLYHLSPLGNAVCDQLAAVQNPENHASQARWSRWTTRGTAQLIREERERLARLLPRLPVWLPLQEMVNELVTPAASALTDHGRQAKLVQWSWLRDVSHPFQVHDQTLRCFVDGALAISLCFGPGPDQETSATPSPHGWYTLLLLHSPLDDLRLMRARLERLLHWRESAERTAVYRQMPPILVLAATGRQAEWWHLAAEQVAARLPITRLMGALTCLLSAEEAGTNGWLLPWQRLGTKEPCHLQELLHPWPAPALPELLISRHAATRNSEVMVPVHEGNLPAGRPTRLSRLVYGLAMRAETSLPNRDARKRRKNTDLISAVRLSSLTLTSRQWELLRLCLAHPLLAREDLVPLLGISRTTLNLLLADLRRKTLLVEETTEAGQRWHLSATGLHLLARLAACSVSPLIQPGEADNKPVVQRGVPGLLRQVQHTAGVYGFFAHLTQELALCADASLRWWETGVLSERHFVFHEKTYRFRPDALACVQIGERPWRFWLEWDRGTMNVRDLRIKFATYGMYLASREWASTSPILPALLCVTPDIAQERRISEAARVRLLQVPAAFRVYTTTARLLVTQGIAQPIWRPVHVGPDAQAQAPPEQQERVALFRIGTPATLR